MVHSSSCYHRCCCSCSLASRGDSLSEAGTAISGSVGAVALGLLLVAASIVVLKKWRRERLFRKQLRRRTNFLHESPDFPCQTEPVYCNVINLAPGKEGDFAIYANMPRFDGPGRVPTDHVEYASVVFR
ncbi:hypothetical protein H920_18939 [Fukomys damarensis]|uniref:Uncharacterized protein n=1 Tax=Fukomys damarensis TaxID=885580 RepID=A0A091CPR8_FUKDA|nr:hypothetical protein H920_18939 [Fukomys damarensis]